ncbi:MAG: hypothetical protein ACRDSZ_12205 [Pseudonocardiaceae bacterium]
MNRLSRVAVLVTVASGLLVPMAPPPALADPIGGVIIIPGTGTDLSPIRLRTSTGCPTQASKYYATMRGHGFPSDGQIITSGTEAGLSTSAGFDVYVALIMRDYAAENHTTLAGRYDITVHCTDNLAVESYGKFIGSLEFTSPTTYQAIGTAKPPTSPPPPWPMAGDDPVLALDPASPPTAPVPAPGLHAPPPAAQPPGADPPVASPAGQLASQRNEVTVQGVPWLVVILVGVVLVALVAAVVARQIRKRRTS